jgi:hypothetical protein
MNNKRGSPEYEMVLAEAQNSQTTSTRLTQLFTSHGDVRPVAVAVMRNPNTSAEILAKNMPRYLDAFCENPVAPLLLLEMPDLLARHVNTLRRILRCPTLPVSFVLHLLGHQYTSISDTARYHIAVAGEVTEGWEVELVKIIAEKIPKRSKTLQRLHTFELIPDWLVNAIGLPSSEQFSTLKKPFIPTRFQQMMQNREEFNNKYSYHPDYPLTQTEREIIESNDASKIRELIEPISSQSRPTLIRFVFERYYTDDSLENHRKSQQYSILLTIVQNKNTPVDILEKMEAYHPFIPDTHNVPLHILEGNLKRCIAERSLTCIYPHQNFYLLNPEIPSDLLLQFANIFDNYSDILLMREDISEELRKLALIKTEIENKNSLIRFIALLSTTKTLFLRKRRISTEWTDRLAVTLNPNSDNKWLKTLAKDSNRYVRAVAKARLSQTPIHL